MTLKRTKIVATLGPSTHEEEIIAKIIDAGVDVARLNFSHGSYDDHRLLIERVRAAAEGAKKPIAIMQDLQGPKIRLGKLPEAGVEVHDTDTITFDTSIHEYSGSIFPVDFSELHRFVKAGDRLLINDGRIQTEITGIDGTQIKTKIIHGGLLSSHKGINVPDSKITTSAMSEKDRADAEFGIAQGVDYIALSFVRSADDIKTLRDIIAVADKKSDTSIKIIAKIERPEAVENFASIIEAADGIMVARGDLGIEIETARVPIVQKQLIEAARIAGKPVIVATQMLDSMQENPTPTRAETADVANAVIDHADAVMLSNETATGRYPLAAIKTLAAIIRVTEESPYDDALQTHPEIQSGIGADVLAEMVRLAEEEANAAAIITASFDGEIARHISRSRPQVPLLVITGSDRMARQLALVSGVYAHAEIDVEPEKAVASAIQFGLDLECIHHHDSVIVALGEPFNTAHKISILKVKEV